MVNVVAELVASGSIVAVGRFFTIEKKAIEVSVMLGGVQVESI